MRRRERDPKGHIWAGAFIILVGVAAPVKSYVFGLDWIFSWQMLLIALGVFIGLKSGFRGGSWLVMILVGGYFLLDHYFRLDVSTKRLIWPSLLILLGGFLILRPKRMDEFWKGDGCFDGKREPQPFEGSREPQSIPVSPVTQNADEEVLEVVAVFAAVRKNIYSKKFKGGEIVSVFGGAEINLTQADFQQQIVIESVQVFGGAKLVIPADWVIHNEAVAIFGGIEDKRPQPASLTAPEKILVLKGFVMFGGIEIKSY